MRRGSQIFCDLSRGSVHKGQSIRIRQRMEMAILHRCNISFGHIAWFCDCHPRTVKRRIIRIELGEPLSDHTRSVNRQPKDADLHYIFDNHSTHFSDEFCKAVAELSGTTYTPLKTGKERRHRLQLQSGNKRITIHFLPFHGSWLNMIKIWFALLADKCLKNGWFESVGVLIQAIIEFIETWDKYFAPPYPGHTGAKGYTGK